MAPQIKHTTTYDDLFSLPVPVMKRPPKKRKSKEFYQNATTPISKKKKENYALPNQDIEIITIDSDSSVADEIEKHDETKVTYSNPKEVIITDSSDDESVKIQEPRHITIELNDSGTEDNLVININQTVSVDKIVDSALGRQETEIKCNFIENQNNITKENDINKVHWTRTSGYPKSWTKDMIRFYTEPCERNRNFNYEKILDKLKTKPSDWRINRADMIGPIRGRRNVYTCRKCDKYGHTAKDCTINYVCYVCGEFNHRFPNCPNTRCLTCGRPASTNLLRCTGCDRAWRKKQPCGICGQISHEEIMCPSKWRKHLLLDSSTQTMRLNPKRCCYNCAQTGHFGFECPYTQNSPYPLENPLISSCINYTNDNNKDNNVIFVSKETSDLLRTEDGKTFFKRFSKDINSRIEFFEGAQDYVRIVGQENKVQLFRDKLQELKHNSKILR